ncbi:NmrA family NAD(P)-binding protein [Polaribacter sp. P097]|uniref:NmrA family NAD(P)-binding protein n=1 Tax=Polaribacter sp. P097 TaxID=3117398 RepID=UPI002FE06C42
MSKILITGATGNIGFELIGFLSQLESPKNIVAGVRDIDRAKAKFHKYSGLEYTHFDFTNPETVVNALNGIEKVFLLRPPNIANVDKYFKPFLTKIKEKKVNKIVFLSVQGVEKSKVIPHHKIEQLIINNKLDYVFIRPSYFMQNLTTTLLADIQNNREIILPSGNAKFNWVDIKNIAEAAAILLNQFDHYKNQIFEITGLENKSFETVTSIINSVITHPIKYRNVSPFHFYRIKKQQGLPRGMIIVMLLLHYLPRFQKEPKISSSYKKLTGKNPTDLKTFIEREKVLLDK